MRKSFNLFDNKNIITLLGAYIILWLNAGNFTLIGGGIPQIVKLAFVALWLALVILENPDFLIEYFKNGWMFFLFCFIVFVSGIYVDGGYFSQYSMNLIYVLIMIAVISYFCKYGDRKQISFLLMVFIVDVVIVTVHTYIELLANPVLARAISTSAESAKELLGSEIPKGVGGYGLCYQIVLMAPFITYFFNSRKVVLPIAVICYAVLILFLFQAQITLALVMFAVLIIIGFSNGSSNRILSLALKFVSVAVSVYLILNISSILETLIEYSNKELGDRLREMLHFIKTSNASEGDIGSRVDLYKMSFDSFRQNPFFGSFGNKTYGSHSTLLDMLGAYGLVGLFGGIGMFIPFFRTRKSVSMNPHLKKTQRLFLLAFVILAFVNAVIGTETMLIIIVIVPLTLKYFSKTEGVRNI